MINTCPGCDRRFRELYEGITTRSVWGPTRTEGRVHTAIRKLLKKMSINKGAKSDAVNEPEKG